MIGGLSNALRFKVGLDDSEFKAGMSGLKATAAGAMKIVAGLALAAATAYAALTKQVAAARNEILDTSNQIGIAADTIQALKIASEGAGSGLKAMEPALRGFEARLLAAQRGSKEAVMGLEHLGVSADDLRSKSLDTIFLDAAQALRKIEDPGKRAMAAIGAFGEAGGALSHVISQIPLDEFVDLSRAFGVDVGPDAARASDRWQREMSLLSVATRHAKDELINLSVAADIMAGAAKFVVVMTAGISQAFRNLKDVLATGEYSPARAMEEVQLAMKNAGLAWEKLTVGLHSGVPALRDVGEGIADVTSNIDEMIAADAEAREMQADWVAEILGPLAVLDREYEKQLEAIKKIELAIGDWVWAEDMRHLAEIKHLRAERELLAQIAQDKADNAQWAIDKAREERDAKIAFGLDVASSYNSVLGDMAASMHENALLQYRMEQAAALVSIAINTAKTIMAWAPAAGPAGVAAAITLGLMQAAIVAATPPPKFHSGGVIGPDERVITTRVEERVVTPEARAVPGVDAMLDAAERGQALGGSGPAPVYLNDRLLEALGARWMQVAGRRLIGGPVPGLARSYA